MKDTGRFGTNRNKYDGICHSLAVEKCLMTSSIMLCQSMQSWYLYREGIPEPRRQKKKQKKKKEMHLHKWRK